MVLTTPVIPYKGFTKSKSKSATLGQAQDAQAELFGHDPEQYIREGQGKAKASQGLHQVRRSGKSGNESYKRYDVHGNVYPRY